MTKAKDPSEESAIERFRDFLGKQRNTVYAVTDRDVEVNPATRENFDYRLQNQEGAKVAVELFRLIEDGKELGRQKVFSTFVEGLKKELLSRGVKGYLISTPEILINKRDISAYTTRIAGELEQAVKTNSEAKKFEHATFELTKINDFDTVAFSYHTDARSVDPRGTAASIFASKLPKKNKQVAVADHERIILVVNWTAYIDGDDVIRALSGFDFSPYENIDKIYFERREGEFVLVYDRAAVEAIQSKLSLPDSPTAELLLKYTDYQLGEKKHEAFEYVKAVTAQRGNIDWLADNRAKENLITCAEDLLAKGAVEDAMWVVRQLENDKDPKPDGTNGDDDPKGEDNYHAQVLSGKEVQYIATVRGRLCWLMMKIAGSGKTQYFTEIIKIMSRYLSEENLYIRAQAAFILGVFWSIRRATKNADGSVFDWKDEERKYIRELALETVRANSAYPRVMQALLNVFEKMRDLSETEAEEMLSLFLKTEHRDVHHNLAAYMVYFAFFREKDAQYYGDTFNSEKFRALLKEQIKKGSDSMRSSLAWHLWKLLMDKTLPYEVLAEYFPLFLEGEYDRWTMSRLALIFEQLATVAPNDAINLYEKALQMFENYLKAHPEEMQQHMIDGTEEMMPILAKDPARLLSVVGRLKDISLMGVPYVGNILAIFGSHQHVPPQKKESVKAVLRSMYDEMKASWPHLQEVDWTK